MTRPPQLGFPGNEAVSFDTVLETQLFANFADTQPGVLVQLQGSPVDGLPTTRYDLGFPAS
jgi:hypothetical protein